MGVLRLRRAGEREVTETMKYLMLVCRDPAIEMSPEQRSAMRDGAIDVRPFWE
jgi:hypothetical protein